MILKTSELSKVKRTESAEGHPDGEFPGFWSGYVVTWETDHGCYSAESVDGVRGFKVPVTVVVQSGKFFLKVKR